MLNETDIVEGNRLIAEFMGLKLINVFNCNKREYFKAYEWPIEFKQAISPMWIDVGKEGFLLYHKRWEWVMPACKRFDTLFEGKYVKPKRYKKYEKLCDDIDNAVTLYEIIPVWQALTKAIKWYNQNK